MVVDGHTTGEPAEGVVVLTQPVQGTGGADAFEGGVQPQGDAEAWVEGGPPGSADPGADEVVKRGEVEGGDEVPDEAGLVVGIEQVVQRHGREELLAVGGPQTRRRSVAHDLPP